MFCHNTIGALHAKYSIFSNYYNHSEVDNLEYPIHSHCPTNLVEDYIVVDYMVDDAAVVETNRGQGLGRYCQVQVGIMELVLEAARRAPMTLRSPTSHQRMKLLHYWYNDFYYRSQMVGYVLLRAYLRFDYRHGHDHCDPDYPYYCNYEYPYYSTYGYRP